MRGAPSFPPRAGGVLFAATVGNALATTPAVHAVFGTFLVPLSQEFGWSRASISAVLAIIALTGALFYPLAGRHADAHGARRMVLIGSALFGLAIAALALNRGSLLQFYLTFLAIGLFGALPNTSIYSKMVAEWFVANRGTALGISAGLGNGLGSALLPALAAGLIATAGWRVAYLGIAALVLAVGLPIAVRYLYDAPATAPASAVGATCPPPPADGLSLREAAGLRAFWLTLVAIALGAGITTAIFSHVVPIVGDRGFGIATGTAVLGVFALVASGWQIATGRLLDRTPGPHIVAPLYGLAIVGLTLLELGRSPWHLLLGGAVLGIALGTQFGALPFFVARYFGLRHFGAILGMMYSAVIAAQGLTPVLLDASFDRQGHYRLALAAAAGVLALGTTLLLALPGYGTPPRARQSPLPAAAP